jgi:hypothetical protein
VPWWIASHTLVHTTAMSHEVLFCEPMTSGHMAGMTQHWPLGFGVVQSVGPVSMMLQLWPAAHGVLLGPPHAVPGVHWPACAMDMPWEAASALFQYVTPSHPHMADLFPPSLPSATQVPV